MVVLENYLLRGEPAIDKKKFTADHNDQPRSLVYHVAFHARDVRSEVSPTHAHPAFYWRWQNILFKQQCTLATSILLSFQTAPFITQAKSATMRPLSQRYKTPKR
jgi:hypothetical protein